MAYRTKNDYYFQLLLNFGLEHRILEALNIGKTISTAESIALTLVVVTAYMCTICTTLMPVLELIRGYVHSCSPRPVLVRLMICESDQHIFVISLHADAVSVTIQVIKPFFSF